MHTISKLVIALTEPIGVIYVIVLLILLAAALRWWRAVRALGALLVVVMIVVGLTPAPEWALRSLEDRIPAEPVPWDKLSGVVVLGGAVRSGELGAERGTYILNDAAERLTTAVAIARRHPELPVVLSGHSGHVWHAGLSEGDVARLLFGDLGVAPERFLFEEMSRNTYENAVETRRLLVDVDGSWLLVTSAFHMPRSVAVFRAQGFDVIPYPVDFRAPNPATSWLPASIGERFAFAATASKEWLGLLAYRLFGRTDALLPAADPA